MIHFFENQSKAIFAVQTQGEISAQDYFKIKLVFCRLNKIENYLDGFFIVPSRYGNSLSIAVEITQNMAISGIIRIEEFHYAMAHEKT
jgi:phosphoribosylformylglycinamidine synthase